MDLIRTSKKVGDNAYFKFKDIPILDIRRNSIPDLCEGKRVLVIGCVDMIEIISLQKYIEEGKHQFHNISDKASYTAGIDINETGIKQLSENGYNVECCDILSQHCHYLDEEYDYVVISHVIEHVIDLTGFIKKIVDTIKTKEFIFAVPNAYNIKHALPCLLFQRERVSNDHYYTFTPITFVKLIEGLQFKVQSIYLDQDRRILLGRKHLIFGTIWSYIKAKVFKHSGDIVLVAKVTSPYK
ncbi:class I SAM-dependent methyltransferase [Psychromonas sp. KJ10-10]|uniref:class I SAM-dependent methyltransferase n=1 Tax=Psychromonas sp. KJ10-10 TaxID=3391823 RepID=UPI0039B3A6CF